MKNKKVINKKALWVAFWTFILNTTKVGFVSCRLQLIVFVGEINLGKNRASINNQLGEPNEIKYMYEDMYVFI